MSQIYQKIIRKIRKCIIKIKIKIIDLIIPKFPQEENGRKQQISRRTQEIKNSNKNDFRIIKAKEMGQQR